MKKNFLGLGLGIFFILAFSGCEIDDTEATQQEKLLSQAHEQTGLPAITNFREKKLLKMIYEMRDQSNLQTYTYIVAEQTGKLVFLGCSIGYGIPAATQYTNPSKHTSRGTLPQADPNGLFSPSNADGTWVMMISPSGEAKPVYIEPRCLVSPFKF